MTKKRSGEKERSLAEYSSTTPESLKALLPVDVEEKIFSCSRGNNYSAFHDNSGRGRIFHQIYRNKGTCLDMGASIQSPGGVHFGLEVGKASLNEQT